MVPDWGLIPLAIASAAASGLMARAFCKPNKILFILDHPNERSLHTVPVPRTGGIAILVACFVGCSAGTALWGREPGVEWLAVGAFLLSTISFLDDRSGLSAGLRILFHLGSAFAILLAGFRVERMVLPSFTMELHPWLTVPLSLLFILWMINLYNFMDGMDGLAGGMALLGFGTYSILGYLSGHPRFAMVSTVVAASAAGFLILNFPPARIFMGDVGSSFLGFLLASLALWANHRRIFPLAVGILVFLPFIADATVTLLRRLLTGEKIWKPHRTHAYQKLVLAGWSPRKVLLLEYLLMALSSASALMYEHLSELRRLILWCAWFLLYAVLLGNVGRLAVAIGRPGNPSNPDKTSRPCDRDGIP